jgi:hypothetical protein
MYNQTDRNAAIQLKPRTGWFNWAEQHPGWVVLGALVVAILALNKSLKTPDLEPDPGDEEVPLFI